MNNLSQDIERIVLANNEYWRGVRTDHIIGMSNAEATSALTQLFNKRLEAVLDRLEMQAQYVEADGVIIANAVDIHAILAEKALLKEAQQ